jgi:hypothetical protein
MSKEITHARTNIRSTLLALGTAIVLVGGALYAAQRNTGQPSRDTDDAEYFATVPVQRFDRDIYNEELASEKVVMLYFDADRCSQCREEFGVMERVFEGMPAEFVAGFRVRMGTGASSAEEAIAREHDVETANTKLLLRGGQSVVKTSESWDMQRYIEEIIGVINLQ